VPDTVESAGDLILSSVDQIGLIRLNRPEFHNAISKNMWNELPEALDRLSADGAKVIVVTGTGTSFASGADLFELERIDSEEDAREQWLSIKRSLDYLWRFPLPTIGMINGACIGGGCLLALACDLRFAVDSAVFGIPVAKLAIVLDDENIFRLARLVGQGFAAEMLFTAGTISGARALSAGLINDLVSSERLQDRVFSTARMIAQNSDVSIKASKGSLRRSVESGFENNENEVVGSYLSDDFKNRIKQLLNR
jgi:enoyl-CoA hydratase/carnithine racemase